MKRFAPVLAAVAVVLAFAAPAQAQVELEEIALSQQLASTVTTIAPQCYYCSSLAVNAFDVLWPSTGSISQEDATWAAFDWLGIREYETAGASISKATFL